MEINLYNTLTRKKENFVPLNGNEVRVYSCGPTVYSYAHIGNFRAYIFMDSLRRMLEYNGYKMKHVMNCKVLYRCIFKRYAQIKYRYA